MEKEQIIRKNIRRIIAPYGLIVGLVNYLGFLVANSGALPMQENDDYAKWMAFTSEHNVILTVCSIMTFVIPFVLILLYTNTSDDKLVGRLINMPLAYSAIGTLGWILTIIMITIALLVAKSIYHFQILYIIWVSFLNIFEQAIFVFTVVFLILDLFHRKMFLPKLFPEGHLSQYSHAKNPSVRFIVHIFYLSVCFFPMFYLTSNMIEVAERGKVEIARKVIIVLLIIFVSSVVIMWIFCDYFNSPISKLKFATQRVIEGDYQCSVDVVSNDALGDLADTFNDMTVSLNEKNRRIQEIQKSIIRGMAVMVESRDNSTGGHINRTSDCVKVFVDKLVTTDVYKDLDPGFCSAVINAAPMHDLGKIAIDDAVLRKPGKFTDEEYEIMKRHSAAGAEIVEKVLAKVDDERFKQIAVNVAHYHHERWDGNGYPTKISGEDIPLEARIMALADVFDALVSKRCYKDSFSYDKAFEIIRDSLGTHFDPTLGKVFIECRPEFEELYNSMLL